HVHRIEHCREIAISVGFDHAVRRTNRDCQRSTGARGSDHTCCGIVIVGDADQYAQDVGLTRRTHGEIVVQILAATKVKQFAPRWQRAGRIAHQNACRGKRTTRYPPARMFLLGQASCFALLVLLYRAYRHAFVQLPLHMDTGYYVTADAIASRRYRPFKGWNAFFSGGSRLLPEAVHSWLFLRAGGPGYARAYRELYVWLALLAALGNGMAAARLVPHPHAFALATLLTAALLAETQYGSYFESAEAFEAVFQALGMASILYGLEGHDALIGLGLALLWLDFAVVKLSAAAPALLTSLTLAYARPELRPLLVGSAALSVALYLWLAGRAGVPYRALFKALRRHEAYVRRNYRSTLKLLLVKVAFAGWLLIHNPWLPALAALGAVRVWLLCHGRLSDGSAIYAAFVLGAILAMLQQGNRVWYYLLPLLLPIAILATFACEWILTVKGSVAEGGVLSVALALSLVRNLYHVRGASRFEATRRVFAVYNRPAHAFGDQFARENLAIELACERQRERVRGESVLVVGRYNQASVLLEAGYASPVVSLCELSDVVAGGLERWLPTNTNLALPAYAIDTSQEWAVYTTRFAWLANYVLVDEVESIRLFARPTAQQ
ncbi:MAG: hypothetical protein RL701_1283, partial [Pseudomonadota bacterium]